MTDPGTPESPNRVARIAGALYLLVVGFGILGAILADVVLVPGDPAASADRIAANGFLFRLGYVFLLIRLVFLTLLVLALYKLFGPVNRDVAAAMVAFVLIGNAVVTVSLVLGYAAPLLLTSPETSTLYPGEQWPAQVQFFIDLQVQGDRAAQIFSVWVILLGFLMVRSGSVPRLLGILMLVAGAGYVADFLVFFLLPEVDVQIAGFAFLAEVVFPFWLLIKGVDAGGWRGGAPTSGG